MSHIAIETLYTQGLSEILYGINMPGDQYLPGLIQRLRAHYAPRQVFVLDKTAVSDMGDEFLDFHAPFLKHSPTDDHTKQLLVHTGRSHVFRKWIPRNNDKIIITLNVVLVAAVLQRGAYPEVLVPTQQGVSKLPSYLTSYTLHRYVTDHCAPDLIVSYEPALEAIQAKTQEGIEKIKLAADAYAAMKHLLMHELGAKCKLAPLAPVAAVLPPAADVIQAIFETITREVAKR